MNPFVPAAVIALLGSGLALRSYLRWLRKDDGWFRGKRITKGTLVRCEEIGTDGDWWSAIEYDAANGHRYQITGNFSHRPPDVGAEVPVAYDPALPSEARLIEGPDEGSPIAGAVVLFIIVFAAIFLATTPAFALLMRFIR